MRRGSISSEMLMCVGGVRSIFIASCGYIHRNNKCMYMAHVCFKSVVVTCGGYVGMFVV